MGRAVKTIQGNGVLLDGNDVATSVDYELQVLDELLDRKSAARRGENACHSVILGQIDTPTSSAPLVVGKMYTLKLEDRRQIEVIVTTSGGNLVSTEGFAAP